MQKFFDILRLWKIKNFWLILVKMCLLRGHFNFQKSSIWSIILKIWPNYTFCDKKKFWKKNQKKFLKKIFFEKIFWKKFFENFFEKFFFQNFFEKFFSKKFFGKNIFFEQNWYFENSKFFVIFGLIKQTKHKIYFDINFI